MDSEKNAIRRLNRRRRRALLPEQLHNTEQAVCGHVCAFAPFRDAEAVLAYVATDGEVPTGALLEAAIRSGKSVFLPRVRGAEMTFAAYDGTALQPGCYDIPEPCGLGFVPDRFRDVVAFVPVVAWDAYGGRLGRGGGFYDRALRALRGSVRIVGLAYSWQASPRLPLDSWDVPLEFVVTEDGVLPCQQGEAPGWRRKEDSSLHGLHLDDRDHRGGGGRSGVPHRLSATPTGRGTDPVTEGNCGPRARRSAR